MIKITCIVTCLILFSLVQADSAISRIDTIGRVVNMTRIQKLVDVNYTYSLVQDSTKWIQFPEMGIDFYLPISQHV